tara:strand:+ start:3188 stop:3652 length:465 start_codon:yes stop_codon:yes gene_type:complete
MGREIKTISLDKMTADLAAKIPNFSSWVRQQLLIEHLAQGGQAMHILPEGKRGFMLKMPTAEIDAYGRRRIELVRLDKCNPHHKEGVCPTCWPPEHSVEKHISVIIENCLEALNKADSETNSSGSLSTSEVEDDEDKQMSAMEQWAEIQKELHG